MKNSKLFNKNIVRIVLIVVTLFAAWAFSRIRTDENLFASTKGNDNRFVDVNKERDSQFLVDAAKINLEEIQLGQLAQKKSMVPDIKDLGKMMEDGHSQAMKELTELAGKKSITIPTLPGHTALEAYKTLNDKSEIGFDKAYCDMMVSGHKNAITLFEKASKESSDPDIKQWATSMLPNLRMHLEHAVACQKKCDKMG